MGQSIGMCFICFKFRSDDGVVMRSLYSRRLVRTNTLLRDYHTLLLLQSLPIVDHIDSELGTLRFMKCEIRVLRCNNL